MTTAMRRSDGQSATTGTAWDGLFAELGAWADAGRTATLWWRDDDAVAATPALEKLLLLRRRIGVPLALAVIPRRVDASLASRLSSEIEISVLQHGYSHDNFAGPGDHKIELDGSRPTDYVIADLATGMQIMAAMPGWLPVLVPPWNRIAPHLLPMLPELGYCGISTLGARDRRLAVGRLVRHNVHIDPVDWRGRNGPAGGFAGAAPVLAALTTHLRDRREGRVDDAEASGIMTHHKVQDSATWEFFAQLLERTAAHPAVRWCAAPEMFAP